jgi:hypothetical protein
MTSLQRRSVLGALILPILLQIVLVIGCRELGLMGNRWLLFGLIPTVAGFVWLERGLRLYAALAAPLYFPLMIGLLFLVGLTTIGVVYDEFL